MCDLFLGYEMRIYSCIQVEGTINNVNLPTGGLYDKRRKCEVMARD